MTNMPLLRRAALVPAAALAAGLLQGSPPAAGEAGGAVVLPSGEIEHLMGRTADVVVAADGTVYHAKGVVVLPAIAFEAGSNRPTPASQAQIEELAEALKRRRLGELESLRSLYPNPGGAPGRPHLRQEVFSIQGHADGAGSAALNEDLSLRRARRVIESLVEEYGVPPDILTVCGRGESAPREGFAPGRVEVVRLGALAVLVDLPGTRSFDGVPVFCGEARPHFL